MKAAVCKKVSKHCTNNYKASKKFKRAFALSLAAASIFTTAICFFAHPYIDGHERHGKQKRALILAEKQGIKPF